MRGAGGPAPPGGDAAAGSRSQLPVGPSPHGAFYFLCPLNLKACRRLNKAKESNEIFLKTGG